MSAESQKETLIRKVQELGKQFDQRSQVAATEAARDPTDRKARAVATHWVGMADTAKAVADEVAQLIDVNWPGDPAPKAVPEARAEKARA